MQHTVLFIAKNSMTAFLNGCLPDTPDFPLLNLGIENHALLGLRRASFFQPDIIFLDSELPHMGISEYLDMLSESCRGFSVLLYRESAQSPAAESSQIVREIGPEELTVPGLQAALFAAVDHGGGHGTDAPPPPTAPERSARALFRHLERSSSAAVMDLAGLFHLQPQDRLQVIAMAPDRLLAKSIDASVITDYLVPRLKGLPNTYFSVKEDRKLCLITPHLPLREQLLNQFSAVYGGQHFYYAAIPVISLPALPVCYQQVMELLSLSYFEPEHFDLNHMVTGTDTPADAEQLFFPLLQSIVSGSYDKISSQIGVIYHGYLRSARTASALETVRRQIRIIHCLATELCAADQPLQSSFSYPYLTWEMDGITEHMINLSVDIAPQFRSLSRYVLLSLYWIHCDYGSALTLAGIAHRIGISEPYLSTTFKASLGINLKDYLTHVRVTHAKELLRDTDQKIMDVAVTVGLRDPRYFSRVFQKYSSMTPSEFRASARGGEP